MLHSCLNPVIKGKFLIIVQLEKLLQQRIISFLDKNKILNTSQFGFRSRMSTADAVSSLLSEIYDSMNSHKYFGTVSLDLSMN